MVQSQWDVEVENDDEDIHVLGRERADPGLPQESQIVQRKKPRTFGPMDSFYRRQQPGPREQSTIENRVKINAKKRVNQAIGRWFYQSGVALNTIRLKSFRDMCEEIGQFGPGFKPPSYYKLREPILKEEVRRTTQMMDSYKSSWKMYGCTVMTDGWTDRRTRSLLNFLVNCPSGTMFLKSIDASDKQHTAEYLLKQIDAVIEEIGAEYVVQVVTDNASANVAAGRLLMEKHPHIYWTPCAAHCLDLMLEYIAKMEFMKSVVGKGRSITTFIYKHNMLLSMMRKNTGNRDLVRAGLTRFATSFLTLQSLYKHRDGLRQLFLSSDWKNSAWAKKVEGKRVANTVFSTVFWKGVAKSILASQPIVAVLRRVEREDERPMGYIYHEMIEAREKIKRNFKNNVREYGPILAIVDDRWKDHMDHPLHKASYFLNQSVYYDERERNEDNMLKYQMCFIECLEKMIQDQDVQDKTTDQIRLYTRALLSFGKPGAIRQRKTKNPLEWWELWGGDAPDLRRVALRILGLCCSASECERNWSTFEHIHTKKRNRLEQKRLNNLVYVQYNQRLRERFCKMKENIKNIDPLVTDELDPSSEWVVSHRNVDQEEHVFEGEDLTWAAVDEAMGATEAIESSRSRRAIINTRQENVYTRRRGTPAPICNEEEELCSNDTSTDEDEDEELHKDGDEDNDIDDDETNNEDWINDENLDLSDA